MNDATILRLRDTMRCMTLRSKAAYGSAPKRPEPEREENTGIKTDAMSLTSCTPRISPLKMQRCIIATMPIFKYKSERLGPRGIEAEML